MSLSSVTRASFGASFSAELLCEFLRGFLAHVVDGGDGIADFLEASRHVRAHAPDADESDFFRHDVRDLRCSPFPGERGPRA
jgi:hypothetical protein